MAERPSDPPSPEDRSPAPAAGDEEAARLLEVGLSDTGGGARTPPPAPQAVAAHFPAYEILEVLGQGGMGVVYKARQRKLDRLVALKVLRRELGEDPAFAERFAREARTLARLQHPHIVGVHDFGEVDGLYYLVMEYVDGVTLRRLMSTGELSAREALAIVPQICDALHYAHEEGVVHRDIKPENVLLDKGGRVKVADFGLAKLTQRGPGDFTLTGTDQVMGTVHYMAPEQYKTPQDVDHRADIFSLGVVFYEMLTGELPVGKFAKPSDAPGLDARVDEIVMRALEREREMRYQHAEDVKTDVRTVVGSSAAPAPAGAGPARVEGGGRGGRVHRSTVWALCLLPIGAAVAGLVYALVDIDAERSIRGDYHTAKAALWTGFSFAVLALVLAWPGLLRARRGGTRGRGFWLAVVAGLLASIGVIATAVGVADVRRDYELRRRYQAHFGRGLAAELPPARTRLPVQVEGVGDPQEQQAIRAGILALWQRYQRLVAVRDLSREHARNAGLYDEADLAELDALSDAEFERRREANRLGMGFVGSASVVGSSRLATPLRTFDLHKIQVDRWQRQATVTAHAPAVIRGGRRHVPSVAFFAKRSEDGWVFVVDHVRIEDYR